MYITQFTVRGGSHFPVDMLRYDACYPATSDDAVEMAKTPRYMAPSDLEEFKKPRLVRLCSRQPNARWTPTEARWLSFGWQVVEWSKPRKV